ncbi:MAG: radical SAM protein [Candidatus Peregrinibacteria bacterium]
MLEHRIETLDEVVHNLQRTIGELRSRLREQIGDPDNNVSSGGSSSARDSHAKEREILQDPIQREMQLVYEQGTSRYSKLVLPAPLSVCYSIIDRCDRRCPHCMSASSLQSDSGLSTEKVQGLFEMLKDAGVLRVDIVGGEPFLRDDLLHLLRYAIQLGLEVTVTTHGGLLTESHAKALAALGMLVQVSLDGPRTVNDRLRGEGSYEAAVRAMRLLIGNAVPVRISCTIQRENVDAIEDVLRLAKELGVCGVYVNPVCAQGRADHLREQVCLTPEQGEALSQQVAELARQDPDNAKLLEMKKAGRAAVFIGANGDYVSQGWAEEDCVHLGNVFANSIRELWKQTRIDHAVHLLQYLQHPLMYRP